MYDAVATANVPASATLVAAYGDGYWNNIAAYRARFPHAQIVEIAVSANDDLGVVLDVENGDATPAQAPGWVVKRRAAGVVPTVYCNASTWAAVKAAFTAAKVAEPEWWIADYDGNPTIETGAVAKQYSSPGPYDLSAVAAYWPGVDPTPETDVALSTADANLVAEATYNKMIAERDQLAFATVYWLRRALDPTLALPTGAGLPGVVAEVAGARATLEAREAEITAIKTAVTAATTALSALAEAGSVTTAEVQSGIQAELNKLGQSLAALK